MQIKVEGCEPRQGGVGIDLSQQNVILEIRPGTAAARAFEADEATALQVGDRVLSVDGLSLHGRCLTDVMQPLEVHEFEVERVQGWAGFSIEDTAVTSSQIRCCARDMCACGADRE